MISNRGWDALVEHHLMLQRRAERHARWWGLTCLALAWLGVVVSIVLWLGWPR